MKLPNWLRYLVYAFLIGVVAWSFLKPQEKKYVNAIISGTDTMIVPQGGFDLSKSHGSAGFWNKTEDTFFHVFTNSIKGGIPPYSGVGNNEIKLLDSDISVDGTIIYVGGSKDSITTFKIKK